MGAHVTNKIFSRAQFPNAVVTKIWRLHTADLTVTCHLNVHLDIQQDIPVLRESVC